MNVEIDTVGNVPSPARFYRTTHDKDGAHKTFSAEAESAWATDIGFVCHMLTSGVENAITIAQLRKTIADYDASHAEDPSGENPDELQRKLKALVSFGFAAEIRMD